MAGVVRYRRRLEHAFAHQHLSGKPDFVGVAVSAMAIHIGTSGWSYSHWTNVLYPDGLVPERRLDYYVSQFGTVELNASYYRWPSEAAFASWRRRLPDGFRLSVKAPGALTHRQRLFGPDRWLALMRRGLSLLGPRLGPLLVQFPPNAVRDHARLSYFLERVPAGMRVALEFRNPTWHHESMFAMLEQHRAAYCVMSGAHLPCVLRTTTDFVYVRLHGPDHDRLYAGSYSEADLGWWADRIGEWQTMGRDVFVYFNNDGDGNAVRNAMTLKRILAASHRS